MSCLYKQHRFFEYTPRQCSNSFVQSTVDVGRHSEKNSILSVFAETIKLLPINHYGYQIMNRSRHTLTKYLNAEKTQAAIDSKLFRKQTQVNKALYEFEPVRAEIEHKEPILGRFFILQCAKLRMLDLNYNFGTKLCEVNKFGKLKMDTDSLYFALAEKELEDCIRPGMKAEWGRIPSKGCTDSFTACGVADFFPQKCPDKHKKLDKGEPGLIKEEFRCTEMLCLCNKFCCCYDVTKNKNKVSCRCMMKHILEQSGDGPW